MNLLTVIFMGYELTVMFKIMSLLAAKFIRHALRVMFKIMNISAANLYVMNLQ